VNHLPFSSLFHAHPDHISHFSKLEGLTIDNVFESEAIKHYATAVVDSFVSLLSIASDEAELKNRLDKHGEEYIRRKVEKQVFLVRSR
jgi:hypothetical protein